MTIPHPLRSVLTVLGLLVVPASVFAGPPLICHPYAIGQAKSLPGGTTDHFGLSTGYDRTNLIADTLALLKPDMPVIVRMETLRRAALYATNEMSAWRRTASVWPKRPEHATHVAQAEAGARPGTLLAANLRSHFPR